jgi:hypothetical protein
MTHITTFSAVGNDGGKLFWGRAGDTNCRDVSTISPELALLRLPAPQQTRQPRDVRRDLRM